jgi:hypothetical protein
MAGPADTPVDYGSDYVETYRQFADGTTHLIRQPVDPDTGRATGSVADEGVVAQKGAKPPAYVAKGKDGSITRYTFNSDGTVASTTQLATSDADQVQLDQARTAYYQSRSDLSGVLAQVDKTRAQAYADRVAEQIKNDDDLEPAKKQALIAQANLNNTKIGLTAASTALTAAKASKLLDPYISSFQQQLTDLQKLRDAGQIDQATYDQYKQDLSDQTAAYVKSGLTAQQRADMAARYGTTQAEEMAKTGESYLANTLRSGVDAAHNGAFAAGNVMADLIKAGPGILAAFGGSPVDVNSIIGSGATDPRKVQVTPEHIDEISQQVTANGGDPSNPSDVAKAVIQVAQRHGVDVSQHFPNGDLNPATHPLSSSVNTLAPGYSISDSDIVDSSGNPTYSFSDEIH